MLTEEDKRRIREEEEYRQQVRSSHQAKQAEDNRALWGWAFLIGGGVIGFFVPLFWLVALLGLIILWTTGIGLTLTLVIAGLAVGGTFVSSVKRHLDESYDAKASPAMFLAKEELGRRPRSWPSEDARVTEEFAAIIERLQSKSNEKDPERVSRILSSGFRQYQRYYAYAVGLLDFSREVNNRVPEEGVSNLIEHTAAVVAALVAEANKM